MFIFSNEQIMHTCSVANAYGSNDLYLFSSVQRIAGLSGELPSMLGERNVVVVVRACYTATCCIAFNPC